MLLSTAEAATYSASEVERRLHSDLRCGLSWQEALGRSKIIGYNELQAPQEDSTFKKYVEQFKNPLILLLLGMNHHFFRAIIYLAHFVLLLLLDTCLL
jgi:Ca2+-transporting ATPase